MRMAYSMVLEIYPRIKPTVDIADHPDRSLDMVALYRSFVGRRQGNHVNGGFQPFSENTTAQPRFPTLLLYHNL